MVIRVLVLVSMLLAGCASTQFPSRAPSTLFQDKSFAAPAERFDATRAFQMSDPMWHFVTNDISRQLRLHGPLVGLMEALYQDHKLKLEYDSTMTRDAAEAFDARSGNCLSLVIMTATFAKALDLQIEFNEASSKEVWSRGGNVLLGSGHVNVTLGPRLNVTANRWGENPMTVDFLPAEELGGLRTRPVSEQTIVAMYANNKSVEALMGGEVDQAYGWARESIRRDPAFGSAYNTLGVVYLHHGDLGQATRVFRYALEHEPESTVLISNLADVLERTGHEAEAAALRTRLAQLEPHPPYYFFDLGMEAMQRGDVEAARSLFTREVDRADYNPEFHFWLALAYYKLGDAKHAQRHLEAAMERSPTHAGRDLYAAKLAWLKTNGLPSTPRVSVPAR